MHIRYLVLPALLCLYMLTQASAKSCRPYAPYLKKYSQSLIAKDFPYEKLLAQDYQESNCRFVISYDGVGSESPAQITWRWWKKYLKPYGIYNLRTTSNFTKAQVLIMRKLIRKAYRKGYRILRVPFQAYNGGWLILKEIKRSNSIEWSKNKKACHRKVIHFRNGRTLKACDINYDYPVKIDTYAYRFYSDLARKTTWRMW